MFVNRYEHSLDSKHRLVLPAKFRSALGAKVYLAQQGNFLAVYSEQAFNETSQRLLDQIRAKQIAPDTGMAFASHSVDVDIDSAGRITIPQWLREAANLENDVIVAGALDHIEVWDRAAYEAKKPELANVVYEQYEAGGIN